MHIYIYSKPPRGLLCVSKHLLSSITRSPAAGGDHVHDKHHTSHGMIAQLTYSRAPARHIPAHRQSKEGGTRHLHEMLQVPGSSS
jgi:hypothetical protein